MRFAQTRAQFYRHLFQAGAEVAHQAANACHVGGSGWPSVAPVVDMEKLEHALKALPEKDAQMVWHAVQMLNAMAGMRPTAARQGPDW